MRHIRFHFDFISPYSWLALMDAERFGRDHEIAWDLRPVVYAKLLDATGLVGPAETDAKRRYTFHDILRCAALAGRRAVGPPAHPFRSLEALRTAVLFRDEPGALRLCATLADSCWGDGNDLTSIAVLRATVESVGIDASNLERRIEEPEVKQTLRRFTDEAIAIGVFGVPTFVHDGALFWGHDRMDHLAASLSGRLGPPEPTAERMLSRPRGADRPGRPRRS